jgi:hypothetical protein
MRAAGLDRLTSCWGKYQGLCYRCLPEAGLRRRHVFKIYKSRRFAAGIGRVMIGEVSSMLVKGAYTLRRGRVEYV